MPCYSVDLDVHRGEQRDVLHDLKLAHRFCNKVILLDSGRAVAFGSPEGVLNEEKSVLCGRR